MIKKHEQMNIRGGYSNSTFVARLFVMLLMCVTLLCGALFAVQNNNKKAYAVANSSNSVNIGDILVPNYETKTNKIFNSNTLDVLYNNLTGKSGAEFSDVENMFNVSSNYQNWFGSNIIQAPKIQQNAGGKAVVLKFGGLEWFITSLTKDRDGENVIATLWLTDPAQLTYNKYSVWGQYSASASLSEMYGTSYIRAVTLNAGGEYLNASGTRVPYTQKTSNNDFVKFTVPDVAGSLTNFIVQPEQIAYQGSLSWNVVYGNTPNIPNENYGTGSNGYPLPQGGYSGSFNLSTINGYDVWKNDYIWLPAVSEIACTQLSSRTIWQTGKG